MYTTPSVTPRPSATLADSFGPRSLARDGALVVAFSLFMALCARISIPLPWTPVPITGQTLAVVLTAASLGPVRGLAVDLAYLAVGLVGLPVFADHTGGLHVVFGATGGYIVGFIPAAYLMGLAARRGMDRTPWKSLPLFAAGQAIIFAVGVPWLAVVAHLNAQQALDAGFYPFILGGIVKAVIAGGVLGGAWAVVHRRDRRA